MSYKKFPTSGSTTAVARPAASDPTNVIQMLEPLQPTKVLMASGPDSSTAYSVTVSFWVTYDRVTWDPTPRMLTITNTAPDASLPTETPCHLYGMSWVLNSGTVTTTGATNGRTGIDAGVEA